MNRPIVLLHGSPGAPASWKGVIKALGEDNEIVTPTLPDHGTAAPPPPRETQEMAATIAAALGPQPDGIVLAGHSYGGNVALQMALSGTVKVAALVLIEPVALAVLPALGEDTAYAEARAIFDRYLERGRAGDAEAVAIMIDFWFGAGSFARMPDPVRGFLRSQCEVNLRDVEATF
ncbi:MAG: alpha/beta fold hydrolase, partial [Reyranellaceae bacterium]